MRNIAYTGILDRLLFTAIVVGLLLAAYGGLRYLDLANQLAANPAAQIHQEGGQVDLESKSEAHGLMAADIERRRLVAEQHNMMIAGGVGLALLGLGWLGYDILRGRRRTTDLVDQSGSSAAIEQQELASNAWIMAGVLFGLFAWLIALATDSGDGRTKKALQGSLVWVAIIIAVVLVSIVAA